ncbi:E3 RID-beta [Simian mastadenovirus C]|uniref:E3 RID-beta n=1 Tax=Simian mastadenovirus C TaxID=1962300 RepID=M9YY39_9ADEN|nr:E3 RID-beta [Simian mastadenovirus C]
MIALLLFNFFTLIDCKCPFTKPWKLHTCYNEIPDTPIAWLYVLTAALVFISTCLGVKLYFTFNFGWLHPNEDLPRYPNALPLQPLPPQPVPLVRAPSVISYFQLIGGDD